MGMSEDALAVLLGFIGGEYGIKKFMTDYHINSGSKMWMKMIIGGLLMYFGMSEGFYFLSNLGIGVGGGGAYEYLQSQHKI